MNFGSYVVTIFFCLMSDDAVFSAGQRWMAGPGPRTVAISRHKLETVTSPSLPGPAWPCRGEILIIWILNILRAERPPPGSLPTQAQSLAYYGKIQIILMFWGFIFKITHYRIWFDWQDSSLMSMRKWNALKNNKTVVHFQYSLIFYVVFFSCASPLLSSLYLL